MSERKSKISTNLLLCFSSMSFTMIVFAGMAFALTHRHIHEHSIVLCVATVSSLIVAGMICLENILEERMKIDPQQMTEIINNSIKVEGYFNKY